MIPFSYFHGFIFARKATKSSKIPGDPGEISGFFGHISTLSANPRMQGFGSEPSEDISSRRSWDFFGRPPNLRFFKAEVIMATSQRQELEGVVNEQLSSRWWQLKYFLFSPLFGEIIQFDIFFSDGPVFHVSGRFNRSPPTFGFFELLCDRWPQNIS